MTKRSVIRCILSVVLFVYLAIALCYARHQDAVCPYEALDIKVAQTDRSAILTPDLIDASLGALSDSIDRIPARDINTRDIELKVLAMDNVETANCVVLNNRHVRLDVVPHIPVARVYDIGSRHNSYYINHIGKRMLPTPGHRLDVPVIVGNFANHSAAEVLPVVEYVNADPTLRSLVSSYEVKPNGDILLVPMMRGHVINFGDTKNIENKFRRLQVFYRKVLPVKGWEYYDTITLKWGGQVVAKRHGKDTPSVPITVEEFVDDVDISTISTDPE